MFCHECGTQLPKYFKFCYECGAKIEVLEKDDVKIEKEDTIEYEVISEKKQTKNTFASAFKELADEASRKDREKADRKKQLDRDGVAYCPKCTSTSLSAQKKGFGIGKAIVGFSINPLGAVAGNIGAKKVRVTCLKCGYQFWAGKK